MNLQARTVIPHLPSTAGLAAVREAVNVLLDLTAGSLAEQSMQTTAHSAAHLCLLKALVATHQDLRALAAAYLREVEAMADSHVRLGQPNGGPAMQAAKDLEVILLDAMNRRAGTGTAG